MSKPSRKVLDLSQGKASGRYIRVTPMKARRMVDLVRGKNAEAAATQLLFQPQSASRPVRKVLEAAMQSIIDKRDTHGGAPVDRASLYVAEAYVDEGPTMKRFRPRAKGRAARILKRTSHITVVVREAEKKKERAR